MPKRLCDRLGYVAMLPSDAASAQLRDGVLAPVRITGLPRWFLEVAVAYQLGSAPREATMVADVLTSAIPSLVRMAGAGG